MSLKDTLIKIPLREVAGGRASNRFTYQKCWAFARMMKFHQEREDYLIGFEFHDDVLVLDQEIEPEHIEFYQVKTRANSLGNWTVQQLTKVEKDENNSILGKLYYPYTTDFKDFKFRLCFVTNKYFNFCDPKEVVCATELNDDDKKKIRAVVSKELSIKEGEIDLSLIFFETSLLSLDTAEQHLKGVTLEFFEKLGLNAARAVGWMNFMLTEIRAKNDSPKKIESFEDFKQHKAFSKREIQATLDDIKLADDEIRPLWNAALDAMGFEGLPSAEKIKILQSGNKLVSEITDASNDILQTLRANIHDAFTESLLKHVSLLHVVNTVFAEIEGKYRKLRKVYTPDFVKALILWCYCEKANELPQVITQS